MDSINVRVAKRLLEIKAVFLRPQEPFTWASGIKSPIYCDNRLILTAPEARNEVEQAIADTVKREYPEAEVLMGTATAESPTPPLPPTCWACPWATSVPAIRTTAVRTASRAVWTRARRSWSWRI